MVSNIFVIVSIRKLHNTFDESLVEHDGKTGNLTNESTSRDKFQIT